MLTSSLMGVEKRGSEDAQDRYGEAEGEFLALHVLHRKTAEPLRRTLPGAGSRSNLAILNKSSVPPTKWHTLS
jgi:hypothetical protein